MSEEISLVTIGIPTYNRSKYLREALESALNQTYPNIEIIVSDNASTDDTQEMMKQYISNPKVKYFRQKENIGVPGNWNTCLNMARGKYFLLLSDDDVLEKEAIEVLVSKFQDERVVMAYCGHVYIDEYGKVKEDKNNRWTPQILESGNKFIIKRLKYKSGGYPSSELFIADILKKYGGYPLNTLGAADLATELIFGSEGYISFDNRRLLKYRRHENNLSQNLSYMFKAIMEVYEFVQKTDKLKKYVRKMRLLCSVPFYKYARHEILRGRMNNPNTLEVLEYLKTLRYKYRRLSLYNLKWIQKLAKFRRIIIKINEN
ncbi:MAG: glycosyltransferase family 2 protein [Nitrososphaeria archaeon]